MQITKKQEGKINKMISYSKANDLIEFKLLIEEFKQRALIDNISSSDINEILKKSFQSLESKYYKPPHRNTGFILKKIFIPVLAFLTCLIIFSHHPSFHNLLLRNLQSSIYPGLDLLRKLTIPILRRHPSLTDFYDESCLLENPYFFVYDMDCSPCSNIQCIPNLTERDISHPIDLGIPFTVESKNSLYLNLNDLSMIHENNREIFEMDARRVSSNNPSFSTIDDVTSQRLDIYPSRLLDSHVSWRINRMKPGRILRLTFQRFLEIPNSLSPSIEKYVFIDEPNARSYTLPNPECNNVMLMCTAGKRLIQLLPNSECSSQCKSFSIFLSAGQTLWYNWWYWRPVSSPTFNSTSVTINYLTSFC